MYREKICLSGFWEYAAPFSESSLRYVPGSYHCVGSSTYRRSFSLPAIGGRLALLCFEGIAYQGDVLLNGVSVGETMQPYSRYVFDITELLKDGQNELVVELADLSAVYGPSEGWENSSGLVRDVYVEMVSSIHIENFFFHQQLSKTYDASEITVEVSATGGDSAQIILELNGKQVLFAQSKSNSNTIEGKLDNPMLWSPDSPILYDLTVEILKDGAVVDAISEKVGFKDFVIRGNRFYLNGELCFLKGVCRHDMWGEQGFTLTDEQIEQDMQMIKAMGANFVRLVHYPHDVRVVDYADRIGLLVSEEPGLWWSDMSNPGVTSGALEVLGRTIIRDRNRVSMAFWLAFNECIFTEEFLDDTVKLVRKLDPYRAVSGANCMNLEMTKDLFSKYNWDFYTFHPYGPLPTLVTPGFGADDKGDPKRPNLISIDEVVEHLSDKPLIFTEWGGWYVHDNPNLYKMFNQKMAFYACEREDGLHLAGMAYWCWNDIYETNRGLPGCIDGILVEGLVDIFRNKRVNYYTQADCFHGFEQLLPCYPGEVDVLGMDVSAKNQTVLDIYGKQDKVTNEKVFMDALEKAKSNIGFFQHKTTRLLEKGPILPYEIRSLGGLRTKLEASCPLIAHSSSVEVPVGIKGNALYLVGMTTLSDAYPVSGEPGELLGKLKIRYTDGSECARELLNGRELCTVFMSYGSSRTDPRAGESKRVLAFSYDKNWERYCLNVLPVTLDESKEVQSIELVALTEKHPILLYGITVLSG